MTTGWLRAAWIVVGWAVLAAPAVAEEAPRRERRQPFERFERLHEDVRGAFREVVADASRSTVAVFADGREAALGAVVESDGLILTKASELEGKVECAWSDGRRLSARILGVDRDSDLALLQVEAHDLPAIEWAQGPTPPVGSWLATPGLDSLPASIGVVSVPPRSIAAPRGVLGVMLEEDDVGPRVNQVLPESGAEEAGLQVNDYILGVNGKPVRTRQELIELVQSRSPGDRLRLMVRRGEDTLALWATLGSRAAGGELQDRSEFQNQLGGALSERRAGFPSVLQHDSVLRPEQCGGPLVDLSGRVVGINIARAGRVESFALPVAFVRPLLDELKSGKFAPALELRRRVDELGTELERLRAAAEQLTARTEELQQALTQASEAEEETRRTAGEKTAAYRDAHEQTVAARQAFEQAQIELEMTRAEIESSQSEKALLEQEIEQQG